MFTAGTPKAAAASAAATAAANKATAAAAAAATAGQVRGLAAQLAVRRDYVMPHMQLKCQCIQVAVHVCCVTRSLVKMQCRDHMSCDPFEAASVRDDARRLL